MRKGDNCPNVDQLIMKHLKLVEAAGVELSRRIENRELIEKLENRNTRNTHDWAFHCTRIAHTKKTRLSLRSAFRKSFMNRRTIPARSRAPIVWMDKSREGTDCFLLADHPQRPARHPQRPARLRDCVRYGDFS